MKRIVLSSTVAMVVLAASAANVSSQTSGAGAQQERPAEKSSQTGPSDAREFINKMAVDNLAEIQLGKLATQQASSPEVKQFGQQMVTDHTQANNQLKQVASQLKVELPAELDAKHKQLSERLSKLKGEEFDREYMAAMVQDHKQTVNELRARAKGRGSEAVGTAGDPTGDQALTQWASQTLPVIEKHLKEAQQIEQKVRKGAGK